MQYTPQNSALILDEVRSVLARDEPDAMKAQRVWYNMAYLRGSVLATLLRNTIGDTVYAGPFKGMKLTPASMRGAFGPALTGYYEHELHAAFEQVIATPYQHILNIGCAFGYYAVGLALRMSAVKIEAFDIDAGERQRATDMAALNNVSDRIHIGSEFKGENFAHYADGKTLVLIDIEGAEKTLLDPALYPALCAMDIIVELHDCYDPSLSKNIMQRFEATHTIDFVINKAAIFDFEPLTGKIYTDPFDSLLIVWERREGSTPWAVMRAKPGA